MIIATIAPAGQLRRRSKANLRRQLEDAIEAALAALDALDGDPDLEPQCEDEGAQCDDEGADSDREPEIEDWGVVVAHVDNQAGMKWAWGEMAQ